MTQYETLLQEADKAVAELKVAKQSRAAFLIRTLVCSLKKETELRISCEQDIVEQRDHLEKVNKEYFQVMGKLPEIK